ncbi:MAG: hypothetical protein HOC77_03545 [Chloroflexi bacterium]|nr:hypothetical protein [Chloroflexota bacterium]MBT4073733.1 hypothetical protein [Chloroflexota bacterium]MBT4514152.1 hypothetical protein [Chloroflexota bacterium]
MNQYHNPFGHETTGGDPDKMRGNSRRPIWLTVVLLILILTWGWFLFGRGGDEEPVPQPISDNSANESS